MSASSDMWAHFIKLNLQTTLSGLPGSFTSCQSTADYDQISHANNSTRKA
jgi:hypothetical protein